MNKTKTFRQFIFSGSYEQDWDGIIGILLKIGVTDYILRRVKTKTGNYSHLKICSKGNIKKLGDYIYNTDLIGLKRKYEKYKLIKDSF